MRYALKLFVAGVLLLSSRVFAADSSTQFELINKSKTSISFVYTASGAKAINGQVKAFGKWATTFDHSALPTLQITTDTGEQLNFEFSVTDEQSIKVEYDKNWKTKVPELKPKFDVRNIKLDGIKQIEVAQKETSEVEKPAQNEESAEATSEATPDDRPAAEAPSEAPAKAKPAEEPTSDEKPAQSENQEPARTLKVKPETLFGVTPEMSDLEKAQKILAVKYLSDLQKATGEKEASPAERTQAQSEATKAYKAQAKLWDGSQKLSYKIVSIMKRNDVDDAKDQKALAAQALTLIRSTYEGLEAKFAK